MKRIAISLLSVVALAGCAKQVSLGITLLVNGCTDGFTPAVPTPLSTAGDFRFIVTVNGVPQTPVDALASGDSVKLPMLPFDQPLRVDVFGLSGSTSTTASSVGSTGDFSLPSATSPSSVDLTIVMHDVDTFAGTPTVASGNSSAPTCATLTKPRAYHAQTLLTDGRVLIYGGLKFPTTPVDWSLVLGMPAKEMPGTVYYGDAEIFDPSTGTFTEIPGFTSSAVAPADRAFGLLAPSLYVDGGAVVVGGETPNDAGTELVGAPNGGSFSPKAGAGFTAYHTDFAHGHGCLAVDTTGQAMVAGGLNGSGVALPAGETIDLASTSYPPSFTVSTPAPLGNTVDEGRADQSCSGFEGVLGATFGALVAEGGGFTTDDGGQNTQVLGDAYLYSYGSAKTFAPLLNKSGNVLDLPLSQGPRTRSKAAALVVQDNTSQAPTDAMLISGGMTCDQPSTGGTSCLPTFVNDAGAGFDAGATFGQLGTSLAAYFPASMQTTELLAFPISETSTGEAASPSVVAGPKLYGAVVDQCEVAFGDGGVLILGGLGPFGDGGFGTVNSAMYLTPPATQLNTAGVTVPTTVSVASPLRQARAGMACTLLRDGSILVTGGYETTGPLIGGGTTQDVEMLSTVEVYRPIPVSVTAPLGQ